MDSVQSPPSTVLPLGSSLNALTLHHLPQADLSTNPTTSQEDRAATDDSMLTPFKSHLTLSCNKGDFIEHLGMSDDIYRELMHQSGLTLLRIAQHKCNMKWNSNGRPDEWGNFTERGKDLAMALLVETSSPRAAQFMELAEPDESCLNWISKWFLCRFCRYERNKKLSISRAPRKPRRKGQNRRQGRRRGVVA